MALPLQNLSSLSPEDRILFQSYGQGPKIPAPFSLVHKAIENTIDNNYMSPAVVHSGRSITYGELERDANILANRLISMGLQPRQRVCLVYQRSIPMVIAILAVLKCGCQYVPMDGGVVSDESLVHILKDTAAPVVLCLEKFYQRCKQFAPQDTFILALEDLLDNSHERASDARPHAEVSTDDGVYVIYTSGSTGKPKGVDVKHRGVSNLLSQRPGNLGIRPGSKVAQLLSVSFDMGAWEVLGTMMNGGTLYIRTSDWSDILSKVDTVIATPSILATFQRAKYPNIKTIALGGEPCPTPLAEEWSRDSALYICCGPTEISILNTIDRYYPGDSMSIGRPIPNTNLYILDEDENPAPIGSVGLMWAGGVCVSRGYVNLPDITRTRYKPDPFAMNGAMMFNTGDLGKWREDGSVEHMGRLDDQVKIKGFRVELDSVSASIEKFPTIGKACAILIEGTLWGFYSAPKDVDEAALKGLVAKHLPYYAVPTKWHRQSTLTLTPNGKIDKRILIKAVSTPAGVVPVAVATLTNLPEAVSTPPPPFKSAARAVVAPVGLAKATPEPVITSLSPVYRRPKSEPFTFARSQEMPFTALPPVPFQPETSSMISVASSTGSLLDKKEKKEFVLPQKRGTHKLRALRFRFFDIYRRLFSVVFLANLGGLIALVVHRNGLGSIPLADIATATAVNLTVAILMRQEYVINILYGIFCSVPTWMPLFVRKHCAKIYHIGGLHSGCAFAATVWFAFFTVAATNDVFQNLDSLRINLAILLLTYILIIMLIGILIMAHPKIRSRTHNSFERIHRFAGWSALAIFWVQSILSTQGSRGTTPLNVAITQSPSFWLLLVATASLILPWLRLRKVAVESEVLSKHAIRLHFNHITPKVGTGIRLSERPLVEWHAFATITRPGRTGFSVVVSNAGDWTKRQIERAPTKLWMRGAPAAGVLSIVPLFKRVVLVATGSGIGPCLPIIMEKKVPYRIFWSTPNPEENFGKEICDLVRDGDPDAIIHNTRTMGRPDMVAMSYRLLRESNAECVCVISNPKLTQQVVYGMESRGVPAYGAIFDS